MIKILVDNKNGNVLNICKDIRIKPNFNTVVEHIPVDKKDWEPFKQDLNPSEAVRIFLSHKKYTGKLPTGIDLNKNTYCMKSGELIHAGAVEIPVVEAPAEEEKNALILENTTELPVEEPVVEEKLTKAELKAKAKAENNKNDTR